jgi:hypothetical protein
LPGKAPIAKAPLAVNLPPLRPPIATRLAFLYAALFLVVGFYLPYMPVWLHFRGMSEDAIALLLAAPLFVRILSTPIISFTADRAKDRRAILLMLGGGSLLSFLALWAADGFWPMLAATVLLAICWTTIMPLIETVAVAGIRPAFCAVFRPKSSRFQRCSRGQAAASVTKNPIHPAAGKNQVTKRRRENRPHAATTSSNPATVSAATAAGGV